MNMLILVKIFPQGPTRLCLRKFFHSFCLTSAALTVGEIFVSRKNDKIKT